MSNKGKAVVPDRLKGYIYRDSGSQRRLPSRSRLLRVLLFLALPALMLPLRIMAAKMGTGTDVPLSASRGISQPVPIFAPLYTPPDYHAVLAEKAPLRVLVISGQKKLAWKSGSEIKVLNQANRKDWYKTKVGETVGIVSLPDGSISLRKSEANFCPLTGIIRLESSKPIQLWLANSNSWATYPAPLIITPTPDGKFSVSREIFLEGYLRDVVPLEMPFTFHPQALRAQAILARTYALIKLGRHANEGADVCDSTHCQVLGDSSRRKKSTDEAVSATKGMVLMHGDKLAEAYYHSCCGGATDDAGYLWGPDYARPYLTGGVDGAQAKTNPYCKTAKTFQWVRKFSTTEINTLVQRNLSKVAVGKTAKIASVTNLYIEERTPYGRAATLRVEGNGASVLVFGDQIRWLFGNGLPGASGLRSTLFDLKVNRDALGKITGCIFTGAGSGHGLGLCQWGAEGRARAGQGYREIIQAYFPGTVIVGSGR